MISNRKNIPQRLSSGIVMGEENDFLDIIDTPNDEAGIETIHSEKSLTGSIGMTNNVVAVDNGNKNPEIGLRSNPSASSHRHYTRISKHMIDGANETVSQMTDQMLNIPDNTHELSITQSESGDLDISAHYIRGKGCLASKKDISITPDLFAEGCKLLQAAAVGNKGYIQQTLLEHPEYIHFRDYDRRTTLHVAASEGKLDIVKMLIEEHNAKINRSDRWGGSPLDDAHRHRHEKVVTFLRSKGATTGSTDQTVNLITAAVTGDLPELQMLLCGINSTTSSLPEGNNEIASTIDINGGDYDGRTASHLAAAAGHEHALAFLISKGANMNVVDNWGGTPLDDAVRTGMVRCIRIIRENGGKTGKRPHTLDDSKQKTTEARNLNVDFSELDVIDKIGSGAFGVIYKCKWRGTLVAAKCIKSSKIVELWRDNDMNRSMRKNSLDEHIVSASEMADALSDFRLETSILKSLRHPNICMLLGYSQTENFEVIMSELMRCSLLDIFTSHIMQRTHLSRRKQLLYAQQLARGMNYLHKCAPPVIHRDLKPANLLIDFSNTLKITDFGLAKVRKDPTTNETQQFRMTGETGSYRYMAPEVFRHEEYTETVDIYSFAMIFYYLLSGRPPWETLSGQKVAIKAAIEADRPIVNRAWDSQISNLMQRCWDENPNARPPFSVIMDELNDYSKTVLHVDIDNISAHKGRRGCGCTIS